MSDSNTSDDPLVGFDETNGLAGDLEGEGDGTVEGESTSDADRVDTDREDPYVAETVQEQEGVGGPGEFHTGD